MAFTDLTVANGWIPVDYASDVLLNDVQSSVVEQVARIERMTTDQRKVLRFADAGVDVVAEGGTIPLNDPDLDSVILDAAKFANRYAFSSEDTEDAIVDAMAQARKAWLSNYAVKLDNAVLGVTGSGGPFTSVYKALADYDTAESTPGAHVVQTAGALTYDDLVAVFGDMETNQKGSLVAIAHPSLKMTLRSLKDSSGNFVVDPDSRLGAGVPEVFGHELRFSYGARTSAAATDTPTGNPLLVVTNKSNFILGVRSGPESKVSTEAQWENDNIELKLRARRAFVLAAEDAARVIEITGA
jgi:HK97 family phage major capsid protein